MAAGDQPHIDSPNAQTFGQMKAAYESGNSIAIEELYSRHRLPRHLLWDFPTYPFSRRRCFALSANPLTERTQLPPSTYASNESHVSLVSSAICTVLNLELTELPPATNVFDSGINSLNAIELAHHLSSRHPRRISPNDLYRLVTVEAIQNYLRSEPSPEIIDNAAKVDAFVREFSSPLSSPIETQVVIQASRNPVILLTGSTGFLGSRIVDAFLRVPDTKIICLVRGEPLPRLQQAFTKYGMDPNNLRDGISESRVQLIATSDISHDHLGCSPEDYEIILESTVVIHCAWKVNFNFAVGAFRSDLIATRQLAQLCTTTKAAFYFCSSFATTFGYPDRVPEEPLTLDVGFSLNQVR